MANEADKNNKFFSCSRKTLVAASAAVALAASSGYVQAGAGVKQSTNTCHSSSVKHSRRNAYRTLEEINLALFQTKLNETESEFFVLKSCIKRIVQEKNHLRKKVTVEGFIKSINQKELAQSFSVRVAKIAKATNFNNSQFASILRVERKSLYDWKKNPDVNVREITKRRVEILEQLIDTMDEGHSKYIAKLTFGSNGHQDLADAFLSENMSLKTLQQLYDKYWVEFDGFFTRAKIESKTCNFDDLDGYGELV